MERRSEHYDNVEEMERGVEDLSDEGWKLQRLNRHPDESFDPEFEREEQESDQQGT